VLCTLFTIYAKNSSTESERGKKNDENLVGRATKARMHCKVVDDEFSKSHFFGFLVVERYKQREKKNRRNVFPVSRPWLPKK